MSNYDKLDNEIAKRRDARKMNRSERKLQRKKRKKKIWRRILFTFFILILAIAGGAYFFFKDFTSDMFQSLGEDKKELTSKLKAKEPISILLMGVDERENDAGRADTLIYTTINPITNRMTMTSIPRDTRTTMIGKGTEDKINHSYAFGGTKMTVDTVEAFLELPVDYYVKINMEGFTKMIDALGGVTVYNDLEFKYHGFYYPEGEITLNGDEAQIYVRMRKQDPRGDFGRQKRQQDVIQAVIQKGTSFSSVTKIKDMLNVIGNNVETNLTSGNMLTMVTKYIGAKDHIESIRLEGAGENINGGYYWIPDATHLQEVKTRLKTELDKNAKPETTPKEEQTAE